MSNPPDTIITNGLIYTADAEERVVQAMALREGRILALGSNAEIEPLATTQTQRIDASYCSVLPGLIDSHLHPYWGAKHLTGFSLHYQPLQPDEIVERVRQFAQQESIEEWLIVCGWIRCGQPDINRNDLDRVSTSRPILLFSNDCHFVALNSLGLEQLGISQDTPSPAGGSILHFADGRPSGILEDEAAMQAYDLVSACPLALGARKMHTMQQALHAQGVTTIMDARAETDAFEILSALQQQQQLTLRICGAVEIPPSALCQHSVAQAVTQARLFAERYNSKWDEPAPALSVKHAKFFIDGILSNHTACLLTPYLDRPAERAFTNPYFSGEQLAVLFHECAQQGLQIHCHTIADGAIEIALDAIEAMRKAFPRADLRPSLAHNELVNSAQYERFSQLQTIATLSLQWAGETETTLAQLRTIIGEERLCDLQPQGRFLDAGVRVAFGSDWPIDPLHEWNCFQLGLTRRIDPQQPHLDNDRSLTVREVLRATTIDAAYALGQEAVIGSLEVGKFADLIVLDRDIFATAAEDFGQTQVLRTLVAGQTAYER